MTSEQQQRQEINLYTLDFHRGDQPISSLFIVKVSVIFFVVLMAVEAHMAWQLMNNQDTLAEKRIEEQTVSQRLDALKKSQPLSQRPKLEMQYSALQKKVQKRKELRSIIGGQKLGNFDGFSSYLTGIARQANPQLSLTHIRLLNGGAYLELQGWTRKAEEVPKYLQRLRTESSFDSVRFGVLSIEKKPKYSHKLQFKLGKAEDGET